MFLGFMKRSKRVAASCMQRVCKEMQKKQKVFLNDDVHERRNPVSVLNELQPGLEYAVVNQDGPAHDPKFTIQVHFRGVVKYQKRHSPYFLFLSINEVTLKT